MTESKKKTTKKEVAEENEAAIKPVRKARVKTELEEIPVESLTDEVVAEIVEEVEEVEEVVEAVDEPQRVDDRCAIRVAAIGQRQVLLGFLDFVLAQQINAEIGVR